MANIKNFGLVGVGAQVQFGKSGPQLINNSGVFAFRDAGNANDANITAGNLSLSGNLEVNGVTTTVNTTSITTADKTFVLSNGASTDTAADGSGFEVQGASLHTFLYDYSNTAFTSSENMNVAATKQYMIAGVPVLSATTLGSAVVNSGLTSVGTLTSLTVSGTSTLDGLVTAGAGVGVTGGLTADTLTVTGLSTLGNLTIGATKTINMGGNVVGNVATGVAGTDAVNVAQLTSAISAVSSGSIAGLQTEVDAIQTSVGLNSDGTLAAFQTGGVVAGQTTYLAAVNALDTALTAEVAARNSAISVETARAEAAELVLTNGLAAEVTRAEGIENAIIASVGLTTGTGALVAFQTGGAVAGKSTYLAAVNALDTALTAASAATAAEVTRAEAAELVLTNGLAAEITRATGAEGTLTSNLSAEVTRAEAAEAALALSITDLTTDAVAEGTTNLYFTAARARAALSVDTTTGHTGLLYNATTGVFGVDQTVIATVTAMNAGDAATLAAAEAYAQTLVGGKTANAGQAAYSAFTYTQTAVTVAPAITGFVHRVKVYVSTAFTDATSGVQVGTSVGGTLTANTLVATTDTDPTIAACYVVELAQPVSAADLVVSISAGASTAGAGYVVIEWI